jgi:hypothetical protein
MLVNSSFLTFFFLIPKVMQLFAIEFLEYHLVGQDSRNRSDPVATP